MKVRRRMVIADPGKPRFLGVAAEVTRLCSFLLHAELRLLE